MPVPSEIDEKARIFPTNEDVPPMVADVPTCQNTLAACAPLMSTTLLLTAVVSVLPIWKMNWAFGLFCALSVKTPVSPMLVALV